MGYHLTEIAKGVFGELSKIQEEVDEIRDAESQNNKIMVGLELSDLYGAIKAYASKYNLTMEDLEIMSKATERAFQSGHRQSGEVSKSLAEQYLIDVYTVNQKTRDDIHKSTRYIEYDYDDPFEGMFRVIEPFDKSCYVVHIDADEIKCAVDTNFCMNFSEYPVDVVVVIDGDRTTITVEPLEHLYYEKTVTIIAQILSRKYVLFFGGSHNQEGRNVDVNNSVIEIDFDNELARAIHYGKMKLQTCLLPKEGCYCGG